MNTLLIILILVFCVAKHDARTRAARTRGSCSATRPGCLCISSKQSGGEQASGGACFMNESPSSAPQPGLFSSDCALVLCVWTQFCGEQRSSHSPMNKHHITDSSRQERHDRRNGESRIRWAGRGASHMATLWPLWGSFF